MSASISFENCGITSKNWEKHTRINLVFHFFHVFAFKMTSKSYKTAIPSKPLISLWTKMFPYKMIKMMGPVMIKTLSVFFNIYIYNCVVELPFSGFLMPCCKRKLPFYLSWFPFYKGDLTIKREHVCFLPISMLGWCGNFMHNHVAQNQMMLPALPSRIRDVLRLCIW